MGLTLDSSVLIDLLGREPKAVSAVARLEREGLVPVLSTVAVFEVLSGIEFTRSRIERDRVELLLRRIPIEPFDLDSARRSAEVRAQLLRAGRAQAAPDVMIAGHALAAGHTLVTRDRRLAAAGESLGLRVSVY